MTSWILHIVSHLLMLQLPLALFFTVMGPRLLTTLVGFNFIYRPLAQLDTSCHIIGYFNIQTITSISRENMLGYLSADIIFSEKQTVFRERSSSKTVSFEKQIMSKDKYPSLFSPQMEVIIFIILQIFFATRAIFKIGEYSRIFPSFSRGIFGYVTCLDQSRASKKIWWIINIYIL